MTISLSLKLFVITKENIANDRVDNVSRDDGFDRVRGQVRVLVQGVDAFHLVFEVLLFVLVKRPPTRRAASNDSDSWRELTISWNIWWSRSPFTCGPNYRQLPHYPNLCGCRKNITRSYILWHPWRRPQGETLRCTSFRTGSTSWRLDEQKYWTLLRKPYCQLLRVYNLFPILWTIPNLFMEIWVLFLEIHNFRRLELSPLYPNVSTHFISWLNNRFLSFLKIPTWLVDYHQPFI